MTILDAINSADFPLPEGYEVREHLPGLWDYVVFGEGMCSATSWNNKAHASVGAWASAYCALQNKLGGTPAAPGVGLPAPCTEAVYAMARKLLWIAYVWNDHNFDHPHKIARKLAQEFGIGSFDQANGWLDAQALLIDASPKGGEPVVTLTIGDAGEEGTQAYFLDRIRDTGAFGKLPPGTYQLAVCSMQATSHGVGVSDAT